MNEIRKVFCSKLGQELPGLAKPPFAGEVGKLIFDKVSQEAWNLWTKDMQIKVINEYRLNMGDTDDYNMLIEQMLLFLNLQTGESAIVGDPQRGKGE